EMLNFKGMRFPTDVILLCIRWYVAYPLSYRHLEEMMEERGVSVDHSSINRKRSINHRLFKPQQQWSTPCHGNSKATAPPLH
ncbi:transposase-like protein, partial [Actimicrobium sp. GrIS 1.19]|nr:transposase-like protein [Actimicrobium sp. GrIS 1.19]